MDNMRGAESVGSVGEVFDVATGMPEMMPKQQGEILKQVQDDGGEAQGNSGEVQSVNREAVEAGADPMMPAMGEAPIVEGGQIDHYDAGGLHTKDGENIEKAWVGAIRNMIDDTRDNPRKRNDFFDDMKEQFMRDRFGREIGGGK